MRFWGVTCGLQDMETAPNVAVINETMAKFYFGANSPIGRKFTIDDPEFQGRQMEIVGVSPAMRVDHALKGKN